MLCDETLVVKKTFNRAVAICSENGARLCTKNELEEKCSANTGCAFNEELIWSSTSGNFS